MKVKDLLKKYIPVRSNADVFVQYGLFGDLIELSKDDLKNLSPDFLMDMRVNAFTITDNVLTLHVEPKKEDL